jgi:hypothetical protein
MRFYQIPIIALCSLGMLAFGDDPAEPLAMTDPVACRKIKGYEDYEPLDEPSIAPDEKLLIYTRVSGHSSRFLKGKYQVHLVQDVNIRKKGQKAVLWGRKKVVDFLGESDDEPRRLYLGTTLGLKGLKPGDYEAELILRDEFATKQMATQRLAFQVVATPTTGHAEVRKK